MPRPLRLGTQALALTAVAALLALLVWKVVNDNGGAAGRLGKQRVVPAPGFALPRLDRAGTLSLASLRGKAVVVNFWASWCIPCKQEAPQLQATQARYARDGLVVLGIDAQDFTGDARKFMRKYGLRYPVVHDRSGGTLGPYGVNGFPETFFVDGRGKLVGERIQGPIDQGQNKRRFADGIRLALGK